MTHKKEVAACKEAIKAGFKTQSQIIAEQGGDIHEVMAARKNEVELAILSAAKFARGFSVCVRV